MKEVKIREVSNGFIAVYQRITSRRLLTEYEEIYRHLADLPAAITKYFEGRNY